jgi:hypothetical protein
MSAVWDAEEGKFGVGGWLEVGWEGVDKMQVEDALPIDGMMLREEERRRDEMRSRYRNASLGTVAAGDELRGGGEETMRKASGWRGSCEEGIGVVRQA